MARKTEPRTSRIVRKKVPAARSRELNALHGALPTFRNEILRLKHSEKRTAPHPHIRGAYGAFATAASNVHAVGIGIRRRGGDYFPTEPVLKVFVFDKVNEALLGPTPVPKEWRGLPVDVEALPVQQSLGLPWGGQPTPQDRFDPIPGGVSISPLNAPYVGTLGCFLRRVRGGQEDILALSNNHVLSDLEAFPPGTPIVQPGPEHGETSLGDAFAALEYAVPINLARPGTTPTYNSFDAAIARVSQPQRIEPGAMWGNVRYDPSQFLEPDGGMEIVAVGRTSGIMKGFIVCVRADPVQVNVGTTDWPIIALFTNVTILQGSSGQPFAARGDSGALVLHAATGHPMALLMSGDGHSAQACNLANLCATLHAWPI